MKKQFFLSTLFAIMAVFAMAQAPTILPAPIDTNTITTNSVTVRGLGWYAAGGPWSVELQANKIGTSIWIPGVTSPYVGSSPQINETKDSLQDNTDYQFRFITRNVTLTLSDTILTEIVRTKPLGQPVDLISVITLPALPKSGFIFTGSSIGRNAIVFGYDAVTFDTVTEVIPFGFNSNFTDTAFFLNNGPNMFHPATIFVIQAVDGSTMDYVAIPGFYSPNYSDPTMTVGTITKTPSSITVPISVTSLGNGGTPTLRVLMNDTSGPLVIDTFITITATGPYTFSRTGLQSNHWYPTMLSFLNPFGMGDSVFVPIKTSNVNAPGATIQVGAIGFTTYTVNVTTNQNGTWDSSAIAVTRYYEDNVLVDSVVGSASSFTRTNVGANVTHYGKIEVVNLAGLSAWSSTVPIPMQHVDANQEPVIDDLFADGPADLRVSLITYGASAGNTSTPRLMCRDMMTGFVDTATVATGLIGSGTVPEYIFTNRIGTHSYQVTVFDDSPVGRVWGNTLQKIMPPPADPALADVPQDLAATTATKLGVNVLGSGEGNNATLKLWLYLNNVQIGTTFSTSVSSGMFNYAHVWDNLNPLTEYKVVVELSAPGKNSAWSTKYYFTDNMNGLHEIVPIPDEQMVWVTNLLGQRLDQGLFRTMRIAHKNDGPLLFTPVGDDGLQSGSTRYLGITN